MTLMVTVNLANAYLGLKEFAEAKQLYEHAIAFHEKSLAFGHEDTAIFFRNQLGAVLHESGNVEESIPHYQAALSSYEAKVGEEDTMRVTVMMNLANAYRDLNKYNQAEALYERVIAIRKKTLGWDHEDTAKARKELELLRGQRNKHQEAGSSVPVVRYKESAGNMPNALSMFRFQTQRVSFVASAY